MDLMLPHTSMHAHRHMHRKILTTPYPDCVLKFLFLPPAPTHTTDLTSADVSQSSEHWRDSWLPRRTIQL
ncbi:hypothetical protein GBAR_LOCUS24098 [Geodia barretti]|uniref:Uncharacterized protein n=1 Tax=Geodia barretti TaxID=519541 RepID=A0AA35T809_GEOBA|nr:hypothetical protein GBAR_LOCUS24098 [Geodia barretti]